MLLADRDPRGQRIDAEQPQRDLHLLRAEAPLLRAEVAEQRHEQEAPGERERKDQRQPDALLPDDPPPDQRAHVARAPGRAGSGDAAPRPGRAEGRCPRARPSRSRDRRCARPRGHARAHGARPRTRTTSSGPSSSRRREPWSSKAAAAAGSANSMRTTRGRAACNSASTPHRDHAAAADHAHALAQGLDLAEDVRREERGRTGGPPLAQRARRTPPARSGRDPRSARRARAARGRAAAPGRCRASAACRASTRAPAGRGRRRRARAARRRAPAGPRAHRSRAPGARACRARACARRTAERSAGSRGGRAPPTPSSQGSRPSTETDPSSARRSPSATRMAVVLPAPFGPRKPNTSPARLADRSRRAPGARRSA